MNIAIGSEWSALRQAYQALIEKREHLFSIYEYQNHTSGDLTIDAAIESRKNQIRALEEQLQDLINQRHEFNESVKAIDKSIQEIFDLLPKEEQMDLVQTKLTGE